mmetsp:Transcript_36828/g.88050  ORF Transcript_36828/g.88050 Transcript_36828/m.88050 type:complete len:209 (+) Transcript_36828:396-1022(+)
MGEVPVPPHERAGGAFFLGGVLRCLLPLLNLWTTVVPSLEQSLGLFLAHAPVLAKAVGGFAVSYREVEGLGVPPLGGVLVLDHRLRWLAVGVVPFEDHLAALDRILDVFEHVQCCPGVEVPAGLESLNHRNAVSHARQKPELELSVVGDDKSVPGAGDESLSDLVLVLLQGRLVLQVGLAARQPPGLGVDIYRVVDPIPVIDERLQRR